MNRDIEDALRKIVVEDKELLDRLRDHCKKPCNICHHVGCGWCPQCSPQAAECDK